MISSCATPALSRYVNTPATTGPHSFSQRGHILTRGILPQRETVEDLVRARLNKLAREIRLMAALGLDW